jgi:hypothetical protein
MLEGGIDWKWKELCGLAGSVEKARLANPIHAIRPSLIQTTKILGASLMCVNKIEMINSVEASLRVASDG